jgi:pimeloyl-ACP methyl ester carboxylesterase
MTTAMQNRWPLYALLGVSGALALSRAYTLQRRQRQLQSGLIRGLRGQWWKVNGQLMHARVALDRARTATLPLVLVHGLGVSGSYFVPAAERLATDFDVYVPDLPGHGLSHTPAVQPDVSDSHRRY